MNREERSYIIERSTEATGASPEQAALAAENRALARLAQAAGPPPPLEKQLAVAFAAGQGSREVNMLHHLFAGRSLLARLALGAGLALGILVLAVLLPRLRLTPQGAPAAGYPAAWAEHESHVLVFDFGHVIEIPPGASFHGEGNFMTLSMAKAVVERLRAEVWAYCQATSDSSNRADGAVRRLGVFAYRTEIEEVRRGLDNSSSQSSSFVAGIVLEDPAETDALLAYLAHIPQLPKGQLLDATLLTARGVPDLGKAGITIGLKFDRMIIQNLASDASEAERAEEMRRFEKYYKPHYEYFSYPHGATTAQIEQHLSGWLAANRPQYSYTVKVDIDGEDDNREVSVKLRGFRQVTQDDYKNPKALFGPTYIIGRDGELIEVDPRDIPVPLPDR